MADTPTQIVFGDDQTCPDWRDWEVVDNSTGEVVECNGVDLQVGEIAVFDSINLRMVQVPGDYSIRSKSNG